MIASQEFWFTEIRFLNDSREFRLACDALVKGIQRYAGTYRQRWLDRGCSCAEFERMVANMCNGGHYEAAFGKVARRGYPFVLSLTEEGDLLSQWRAYGKGEYCIGFDATKFLDLMQVNYATSDNPADLAVDLGWFFSEHLEHIRPGGTIDPEVLHDGVDDLFARLGSNFFVRHKDRGFHEEKEWRLVVHASVDDPRLFLDASGRYPKPRLKVKPFIGACALSEAIVEIVCGPGADQEMCKNAFSILEQRLFPSCPPGAGRKLKLSFSSIPYRTTQ